MENLTYYLENISGLSYLFIFLGGIAASFSPCIFPIVPIIMGVIGASNEKSKIKNFSLAFSYVMGLCLTFTILGMAAALTGKMFGQVQSSPLANLIVGNVMIFFALSLLGVISLPAFLLNKIGIGKMSKKRNLFSIFLMGALSGLIASPCTVAVLGAVLAFVATTQSVVLGASLLFTFALGMGMILLVIGTFTGIMASLPKSEKLMIFVTKIFAVILILMGEYFIFKAGNLSL